MAANLLKTSIVLQAVFPESTHSLLFGPLNKSLKAKLREHALVLRALHAFTTTSSLAASEQLATLCHAKKEDLVYEVYTTPVPLPSQASRSSAHTRATSPHSSPTAHPHTPRDRGTWQYLQKCITKRRSTIDSTFRST
ncbi:hypothetical protein FIBSPDRAFT_847412 [Athelia psychrophila]|uniref:Uncharacterized protein n=1 Tax=Athelia psychrophila TaxID=1759441 RepID=A0A166W870_9AGAM|nr:hypothetical protein FIBSPDRAFT_847412 [Fibularhizoctonia sp. CBS 109695]